MKKTRISACALALASLIAANNAFAFTWEWTSSMDDTYSNASAWFSEDLGGVSMEGVTPEPNDILTNDTATTLNFDGTGGDWTVGALWLGLTNGTAPQVSQTAGKLVFGGELYYDDTDIGQENPKYRNNGVKIGVTEGSNATYELSGGTVLTNGLVLGQAGHGTLDISGGAIIVGTLRSEADGGVVIDGTRYNLGTTYVGVNRADTPAAGNEWQNPYPGGLNSYGTMNISAGKFWGGDIRLGEGADGPTGPGIKTGELNVSGTGALELGTNATLHVGNSGGVGVVNQTGGSVKANQIRLGQHMPNSNGTYNLTGGSVTTINHFMIAPGLKATGKLVMAPGTTLNAGVDVIMSENGGTSTLKIGDGATVNVAAYAGGGWMYVGKGSNADNNAIGNATVEGGDNVTINIAAQRTDAHDMRLRIGQNSTGKMTLGNDAKIDAGRLIIGFRDGQEWLRAKGTLEMGDRATIITRNTGNEMFWVGHGADGVLTVGEDSSITVSGEMHVGNWWEGSSTETNKEMRQGRGIMTVGAGSTITVESWVAIGRGDADGTLNLNGTEEKHITFFQNPSNNTGWHFEMGNSTGKNKSVLNMSYTDLNIKRELRANVGVVVITHTNSNVTCDLFNIGQSGSATYTMNGGTLKTTGDMRLSRGDNPTTLGSAKFTLNSGEVIVGNELIMGRQGTSGELVINGGSFTAGANHSKPAASIGVWGDGKGTSTGVITQNGSTATFNGELRLAQTTESSGTYNLNGGTLTANYTVSVARGGTGVLNMADGTTLIKGAGVTSVAGAGTTGDGSGSNAGDLGNTSAAGTYTPFIIAWGGTGTFNQNGGTLTFTDRENTQMWVGYAENEQRSTFANATWNMNGGVANIGLLQLGKDHAEKLPVTSTVNLNGGVISVRRVGSGSEANITGTFNFNGGTLQAGMPDPENYLIGPLVDVVNVQSNSTIDTYTRTTRIVPPLHGTGNLTITGGGTFNIQSDESDWTGAIVAENDTAVNISGATLKFVLDARKAQAGSAVNAENAYVGGNRITVGNTTLKIVVADDEELSEGTYTFNVLAGANNTGSITAIPDVENENYTLTYANGKITLTVGAGGEPPTNEGFAGWQNGGEFSAEELADETISGPEADPQNIGVPNLLRYALGLGRNESPVGALPTLTKNDTAGGLGALSSGDTYTFSYRYDATKEDITYIVETSEDLKNWSNIGIDPIVDANNGTASVVISADGAVRKFFRLKIVQN